MKNIFKKIVPFLLILALLTGCGTKNEKRSASSDYYPVEGAYSTSYGYSAYASDEEVAYLAAGSEVPAAEAKTTAANTNLTLPEGRKIIRNADLSLQTREYDAFMAELQGRIASAGGYIESSYTSGSGYSARKKLRSAEMTVRIPAENLDLFLEGVSGLGNVLYKNIYTNDVTASYTDTEARLKALRTERDTLMGLLEKADKMEDTIIIYERISNVTYEIESYESTIRSYDNKIAYSTVSLNISEVERETVVAQESTWQEISRRLGENFQDILDGGKELFISLVAALPRLALVALFFFVIFLIVRGIVRKCRKKAAEIKSEQPKAAAKPAAAPAEPKKPENGENK